jgi:hypothetical protein
MDLRNYIKFFINFHTFKKTKINASVIYKLNQNDIKRFPRYNLICSLKL